MPTLRDIENLVIMAQGAIHAGNSVYARNGLWPQIKDAIGNCGDLTRQEKRDLARIIADYLDKLSLHARAAPGQLLDELRRLPVPPRPPVTWFPW